MYNHDSAVFFEMWHKSKDKLEPALTTYGSIADFGTPFDSEIEEMLMLLKLLPLRQCGKTTSRHRLNFQQAIEKLIVFSQVSSIFMACRAVIYKKCKLLFILHQFSEVRLHSMLSKLTIYNHISLLLDIHRDRSYNISLWLSRT